MCTQPLPIAASASNKNAAGSSPTFATGQNTITSERKNTTAHAPLSLATIELLNRSINTIVGLHGQPQVLPDLPTLALNPDMLVWSFPIVNAAQQLTVTSVVPPPLQPYRQPFPRTIVFYLQHPFFQSRVEEPFTTCHRLPWRPRQQAVVYLRIQQHFPVLLPHPWYLQLRLLCHNRQ